MRGGVEEVKVVFFGEVIDKVLGGRGRGMLGWGEGYGSRRGAVGSGTVVFV